MKNQFMTACLAGLLFVLQCGIAAGADRTKVQLCPLVKDGNVKFDGRVEDKEWAEAAVISGFNTGEAETLVGVQTLVYAKRTKTSLLLGIVMFEPAMDKLVVGGVGRDGKLWWNDSIEIFLDPGRKINDYFHFIIGADGTLFDERVKDKSWDTPLKKAIFHGKDRWSMELEIPFEVLEANGSPGQLWGVNYCRTRRSKQPVGGSWASVPGGNHQPKRFGVMYFSEKSNIDDATAKDISNHIEKPARVSVKDGFVDVDGKKVSRYKYDTANSETFKKSTQWAEKLKAVCKTAKESASKTQAQKLLKEWDTGTLKTAADSMPILKWVSNCRASDDMVQKMRNLYWNIKLEELSQEINQ